MEIEKIRVELGGGKNPRKEGWINVDIIDDRKVDLICDFEKDKLPFKDDQVDEIFCSHCLEHIENVRWFLNECHRILKKDGFVEFVVPYGLWSGACKPVHKQMITESWFDFLRRDGIKEIYGFEVWNLIDGSFKRKKDKEGNICELSVKMQPKK